MDLDKNISLSPNKNKFKIMVLEDNVFYNNILTKRIMSYVEMLSFAFNTNYKFDLQSYTTAYEGIKNLKSDTDIVFIDYFLDHKINASDLFDKIRTKCRNCKIVVISNIKTIAPILQFFTNDAITFIYKDEEALTKMCRIVDEVVTANRILP